MLDLNSQGASNSQVELGLQVAGTNNAYSKALAAWPDMSKLR